MRLAPVDYVILGLYFAFVLGIGWRLRKKVHSSADFLTSGRDGVCCGSASPPNGLGTDALLMWKCMFDPNQNTPILT